MSEQDRLELGWRVALALEAENEETRPKLRQKTMMVSRRFATVRARAYQAQKERISAPRT